MDRNARDVRWQAAATFLRSATSVIAALLASMIPLPDTMRYLASNALTQLLEAVAQWMERIEKPQVGAVLLIPATSKTLIKPSESDINNILTFEFRAILAFLAAENAVMRTQRMFASNGKSFEIPIYCEPIVKEFSYKCTDSKSCSRLPELITRPELMVRPELRETPEPKASNEIFSKFRISLYACEKGESDKKIMRIDTMEQLSSLAASIEFMDINDQRNIALTTNPNKVLEDVLNEITSLVNGTNKKQETKSTREVLNQPGLTIHRRTENGSYNYLFDDVLNVLSLATAESQCKMEAMRTFSNIATSPELPSHPVSIVTEKYGTITILFVSDVASNSPSTEKEVKQDEYLFVASSLGRKKALHFLSEQSHATQRNQSLWGSDTIPVFSLNFETKEDGTSRSNASWYRQEKAATRTLRTSFFTKTVQQEVFGRLKELQKKKEMYMRASIPTKIGFVLVGPPGTGKSTLPLVVAHELGCIPLVLFSFASIHTTNDFAQAISSLKGRLPAGGETPYVVSIDDIEKSAFFKSLAIEDNTDLSVFLNWLDGVDSGSSRVVFISVNDMTLVNKVNEISKGSLLRSGRLNYTVEVTRCDKNQFVGFFEHVFQRPYPADETFSAFDLFTIADLQALLGECEFDSKQFMVLAHRKMQSC
jgi:hypothetical protein